MRSRFNKRITSPKLKVNLMYPLISVAIIVIYSLLFICISNSVKGSYAISQFENGIEDFLAKNSENIFEIKDLTLYSSASARINAQNYGMDIFRIYRYIFLYF